MAELKPVKVALDISLTPWEGEVKYVFRTLLRMAGLPYEFMWVPKNRRGEPIDIYYGPKPKGFPASVNIIACGKDFTMTPRLEPCRFHENGGVGFLDFGYGHDGGYSIKDNRLHFSNDIIFASYWLLTGAREPYYPQDRWGNLRLEGSFFLENSLGTKPLISIYGSLLRKHFRQMGYESLDFPWLREQTEAVFAFSHDVDYPQMIRWIECLRLLQIRGLKSIGSVAGVLLGTNNFWKFSSWVEFEIELGTRPVFYFMARKGSPLHYMMGTPDVFYDIRAPEFGQLFRYLSDEGCEIGLHASYNAYRSLKQLQHEKKALEEAAGIRVDGIRHHFWHFNHAAPHETIFKHEQAGLLYDSSFAFEFYPGFQRGICHPFRVFHPVKRRELNVVELPLAWMDDHFYRRMKMNKIVDPEIYAGNLVKVAKATGGTIVVDYHVRGMNRDFYPAYGPWLMEFVRKNLDSSVCYNTPYEIVNQYIEYEKTLEKHSFDRTESPSVADVSNCGRRDFEIGQMRDDEVAEVAQFHFEFFGARETHVRSLAKLGCEFLKHIFYQLNLDNPYFFVDVARYRGKIIGFNVYVSDRRNAFRYALKQHFGLVFSYMFKLLLRQPITVASHVPSNLRFLTDMIPDFVKDIRGYSFLLGVRPEFRAHKFKKRTGIWVSGELWQRMECTLRQQGCEQYWGVVGADNAPMNRFWQMQGELIGKGPVQGILSNYYRKSLVPPQNPSK